MLAPSEKSSTCAPRAAGEAAGGLGSRRGGLKASPTGGARSRSPAHALPPVASDVPAEQAASCPSEGSAHDDGKPTGGALNADSPLASLHVRLHLSDRQGAERATHRASSARIATPTAVAIQTAATATAIRPAMTRPGSGRAEGGGLGAMLVRRVHPVHRSPLTVRRGGAMPSKNVEEVGA